MTTRIQINDVHCGRADDGRWEIEALTADGARFHFHDLYETEDRAVRQVARIASKGSIDPDLWVEGYPVYGSRAWEDEDAEALPYRMGLRAGFITEHDVPEVYRALM